MTTGRETTKKDRITAKAVEIIESNPDGIRYSELVSRVHGQSSDTPVNTVHGTVWNLDARLPKLIYKPARGLFRHTKYREVEVVDREPETPAKTVGAAREEDFYRPFADWLVNETEECTRAIPIGGDRFRDKWGTPDVMGKWESLPSDIVKASTELVSAEIKLDRQQLITAFGQACAYRLFSHKVYLVIPDSSSTADIDRLDALCSIYGLGLVTFDTANTGSPQFAVKVRPLKQNPDMFYLNKYAKMVERDLFR